MRGFVAGFVAILLGCGGNHKGRGDGGGDGTNGGPDACANLQCQVVNCAAMSMPATTISGTVYAPNGTLPLYGINVYVPNSDPGPLPTGLACDQCSNALPGSPVGKPVQTDEAGHFTLMNMPSGSNIPVVITQGKWRRILNIANVGQCMDNAIANADTRLPSSIDDMTPNTKMCGAAPCVDMPKIAMTTGGCDVLECLARDLGIADKEFTNSSGSGHVHLYAGTGGASSFDTGFGNGQGGQPLSSATTFWGGTAGMPATLASYDITMMSCECRQNPNTKMNGALPAMKSYADMGGRVFTSHWQNIWIGGAFQSGGNPAANAAWANIANWQNSNNPGSPDLIDEVNNPKGMSFATWMLNVMGSTVRDQIVLQPNTDRSTTTGLDGTKAEQWTYTGPQSGFTPPHPQNFQFTTPIEQPPSNRCGKVVFSDMHVAGGPQGTSFPSSCGTSTTLTPQEKALAFMFFDIASCVNPGIP